MIQLPSQMIPFVGAVLLITAIPGPDTALVVRNVIVGGRRCALATALGSSFGLVVWGAASALGIAALLRVSDLSFMAIRFMGAGYLCYLGLRLLHQAKTGNVMFVLDNFDERALQLTRLRAFRQGLLTDLLNPKAAAFFTALLPQFISPRIDPVLSTTLLYALIAALAAFAGLLAYATVAARARPFLSRRCGLRVLDATTGAVLLAIGGRLAWKRTA